MPFAERDNRRLHYEVLGKKGSPPLLLVMGMSYSSGAWYTLPERLAEHFRVVSFDNVGTGQSSPIEGPLRMRDMAEDARAVMDATGIESGFVFGVSMGGMIAQELVLHHRQRVQALALGCTFAHYLRSHRPGPLTVAELLYRRLVPGDPADPEYAFRVAPLLVSREYVRREPERYLAWFRQRGAGGSSTTRAQMGAVMRHDAGERLVGLELPTLLLTGDEDRIVPHKNSLRLSRLLPRARLVELPGAGHCFPLEREDETLRALGEHFLGARA